MPHERAELAWCLLSPGVMEIEGLPRPGLKQWLESIPDAAIEEHFQSIPQRLGRRFEAHWQWMFATHPDWCLHAADFQITANGRTIGAPDILLNFNGATWHVELAVKFYLCRPDRTGSQLSDWIGPQGNDRLDLKIDRIRSHQLPLLERPEARQWLDDHNLPRPTRRAAVVKGALFARQDIPLERHESIEPPTAKWCSVDDLGFCRGRVLKRHMWLGDTGDAVELEGAALENAVREAVSTDGPTQIDNEGTRWFVVPEVWP